MKAEVLLAETDDLKAKAFDIRQEVFVVEQKVSREEEFDQFEDISRHFVAMDEDLPIGAARWRKTEKGIKLERFAVKKSYRSKGIGAMLVGSVLTDIQQQIGTGHELYLHAQLTAVPLYEKFGFSKHGDQFSECNIWHYHMSKTS